MKLKKRGFTMVELIIVISVIAVLTVVFVPMYIQYVAKSRQTTCDTNRATLSQEILVEWIASGMEEKLSAFVYSEDLTNVCPADGICSVSCNDKVSTVSLICSIHGAFIHTAQDVALNGIEALLNNAALNEYLKSKGADYTYAVDSEAPSADDSGGLLAGVASDVNNALGFNGQDISWRVYKSSSQLNYFWANQNISEMSLGASVEVYKYDAINKIYYVGTGTVGIKGIDNNAITYRVLSVGSVNDWNEVNDTRK